MNSSCDKHDSNKFDETMLFQYPHKECENINESTGMNGQTQAHENSCLIWFVSEAVINPKHHVHDQDRILATILVQEPDPLIGNKNEADNLGLCGSISHEVTLSYFLGAIDYGCVHHEFQKIEIGLSSFSVHEHPVNGELVPEVSRGLGSSKKPVIGLAGPQLSCLIQILNSIIVLRDEEGHQMAREVNS